jgi:hypothetical protein
MNLVAMLCKNYERDCRIAYLKAFLFGRSQAKFYDLELLVIELCEFELRES